MNFWNRITTRLFNSLVTGKLVYNTCWEDPRIDRELLELDGDSKVVMITSAGDNALAYLLDAPARIHAVDTNPRQNALLDLKRALFKAGDYDRLFAFFGAGHQKDALHCYHRELRPYLQPASRSFWDEHINYFSPGQVQQTFFYRGTAGKFAWMMRAYLARRDLMTPIRRLLNAGTLEEQRARYEEIEPRLWSAFNEWIMNRDSVLALLGVPSDQRAMIERHYSGGIKGFIQQSLRRVFTQLPVSDNYFWRVYLTGSYTPACCPDYLRGNHFELLKNRIDRVQLYNDSLIHFLRNNPGSYTHFVLLDHQDWLSARHRKRLAAEWQLIFSNAAPGARVLFRSAAPNRNFLPDFVHHKLRFEEEQTQRLHPLDRVGTYGSTHLGIID